jgi:hypothetical protein
VSDIAGSVSERITIVVVEGDETGQDRAVSEFAFRTAARMSARVYGGPKWTVSPIYEGMLKEELDAAAARHPDMSPRHCARRHEKLKGESGYELGPRHRPVSVRCLPYSYEHMFQSSTKRLRAWLSVLDDVLGDPPLETTPHPHRRQLRCRHERRGGSVPARPAHCLSPVRADSDKLERGHVERDKVERARVM